MKSPIRAGLGLLAAAVAVRGAAEQGSPIAKVLQMISELQQKVIAEGEVAQKQYAEFAEWCEDRARDLSHEIKTGKGDVESLKATIDEETASIASLTTKVEELAAGVGTNDNDLKAATKIRQKEKADFAAEEEELMESISMLNRATTVLEREAAKGSASMLQMKNANSVVQALSAMVEASLINSADASKLSAFVQESNKADEEDDDTEPGAPAAAAYENQGSGVIDTLQDLTEKAENQLDEARKKEATAQHNFELMEQSLKDEIRFASKELDEAKKGIAASTERKSTAQGDLAGTSKELAADVESKGTLHHDCMTKASDFEAETSSRSEELKALAEAKKIIQEATGGAAALAEVSLVQVRARLTTGADVAHLAAVRLVRDLAKKENSAALAQLATRISSTLQRSSGGDAFEKVRGLIEDLIAKLEDEAEADATKKAYCDKELKETNDKKSDKSDDTESLSTKLESATAKSAMLKDEVAMLQNELSKLMKSQAEMDKLRQEQKATYEGAKAELEKGLQGIKLALKVLKEYYASDEEKSHDASEGGASGIIGLLEVCESDFSKNLAEITSEEETAVAEYEETTKANSIEKTAKEQDVKYKVKESKELDKSASEFSADRNGVQTELDAVLEYLSKIEEECTAKAEPYEERARRREAEVAGLKEALETLESETALIQRSVVRRRSLRGRQGALRA